MIRYLPGAVSSDAVEAVMRLINLDILQHGLDAADLRAWHKVNTPFPHLRLRSEVSDLAGPIVKRLGLLAGNRLCEPQIIWHWPDEPAPEGVPFAHRDSTPDYAGGRPYTVIVGIALTRWRVQNGTLRYWHGDETSVEPCAVVLDPGDAFSMSPDTWHTAGWNRSGQVRAGVYLRWLAEESR